MSMKLIGRATILMLAFGMTVLSAPAEARIVIEPTAGPRAVKMAPHTGQWLPSALFQGSLFPSMIAVPLGCGFRTDSALRARVDRLFQQQHLSYTLARARYWRNQR